MEFKSLDWDSNFFGLKIGKATTSSFSNTTLLEHISEWKDQNFELIYLFEKKVPTTEKQLFEGITGKLVDTKITYHKQLLKNSDYPKNSSIKSLKKEKAESDLINLALQSGAYSRFKLDTNFPEGAFEKLYEQWISKSINGTLADVVFVFNEGTIVKGMVTLKIKAHFGSIGLIAVDASIRGQGVGQALLIACEQYCLNNNINEIRVATQQANEGACKFYEKAGYQILSQENIYHLWLNQE